jgi:hypothetical protein
MTFNHGSFGAGPAGFNNADKIKDFTSAIGDNGRRGEPLPGCDCMRCFGYCMIDAEVRQRDLIARERNAQEDEAESAVLLAKIPASADEEGVA